MDVVDWVPPTPQTQSTTRTSTNPSFLHAPRRALFPENKDESEGRSAFLHALETFLKGREVVDLRVPVLGKRPLDLYALYREVTARGGVEEVILHKRWSEIRRALDIPETCTSAAFSMRNHYERLLFAYEQTFFFGIPDKEQKTSLPHVSVVSCVPKKEPMAPQSSPPLSPSMKRPVPAVLPSSPEPTTCEETLNGLITDRIGAFVCGGRESMGDDLEELKQACRRRITFLYHEALRPSGPKRPRAGPVVETKVKEPNEEARPQPQRKDEVVKKEEPGIQWLDDTPNDLVHSASVDCRATSSTIWVDQTVDVTSGLHPWTAIEPPIPPAGCPVLSKQESESSSTDTSMSGEHNPTTEIRDCEPIPVPPTKILRSKRRGVRGVFSYETLPASLHTPEWREHVQGKVEAVLRANRRGDFGLDAGKLKEGRLSSPGSVASQSSLRRLLDDSLARHANSDSIMCTSTSPHTWAWMQTWIQPSSSTVRTLPLRISIHVDTNTSPHEMIPVCLPPPPPRSRLRPLVISRHIFERRLATHPRVAHEAQVLLERMRCMI